VLITLSTYCELDPCCVHIAGTLWGCADRVAQGSVPNEHGTWQYGRAGWCDGQQVTGPVTLTSRHDVLLWPVTCVN